MAVGRLLSLAHRRGTRCQNVYVTRLLVFLFLAVFSKHPFSQSTNASGTLEALATMHYINLCFTLHYMGGLPPNEMQYHFLSVCTSVCQSA